MGVQPMDEHVFWMAIFASFVAPFGGFLASGFKRAFKIKDFGDSIPGHGGITDRFDCQIMMGMFTSLYLSAFVYSAGRDVSLAEMLGSLKSLSPSEQAELMA